MTRIISGSAGGRRLKVPASGVRPTGDRAREGLFNSLGSLLDLDGAAVLDLYAGSGALGLEALSRGARSVPSSGPSSGAPSPASGSSSAPASPPIRGQTT